MGENTCENTLKNTWCGVITHFASCLLQTAYPLMVKLFFYVLTEPNSEFHLGWVITFLDLVCCTFNPWPNIRSRVGR